MPDGNEGQTTATGEQQNDQQTGEQQAQTTTETWDPDRARNTIQTLRGSERELKKQLADREARLKELEDKDKSEAQKLREENEKLLNAQRLWASERREYAARTEFTTAAQKANAMRPDALFKLASSDVKYNDDGAPTNIDELITSLKGEYPEMFQRNGTADGASGRQGGTANGMSMNDKIRQAAGRM